MKEDDQNNTSVANLTPHSDLSADAQSASTQKFVILALSILALAVFFLLPRFVSQPWIGSDDVAAPVTGAPAPSEVSPSTAAEKTKYRQDSQKILAEIIGKRDQLLNQNVGQWAETDFRLAVKNIDTGDEQYGHGEYEAAIASYEQGLKQLDNLLQEGQDKLLRALTEGTQAIESLDFSVASKAAQLALLISPDDARVKELATRSEALPEVSRFLQTGDTALAAGQLTAARSAYQAAVELDPLHERARDSLFAAKKSIVEGDFRRYMSTGYRALDENEFDQARSAFLQAGKIHQGNESVAQALALVENRRGQLEIGQQIDQAAQLESREEWQQAVNIYESLLKEDPTLVEVKAKLLPARVRSNLDEQLARIIADPLKLADGSAYRNAQSVLRDARGISSSGEKLRGQIAAVEKLLKQAVSTIDVKFQSDNQTDVTLYRVARLGQFEQTTIQLKPGRYVAAGTRKGFRDVRVEFTVTGEPGGAPIVVLCDEPI